MDPEQKKEQLEWSAFEYEDKKRSVDWYWAVGIIAVCGSVAAVILNDPLFAVFIVIAAALLVFFSFQPPKLVSYKINKSGLYIADNAYSFDRIKAFWITQPPHAHKLIVVTDKSFLPMLVIPIDHIHEDDLRRIFAGKGVLETKMEEPVAHRVMEYLGF